MTQPDPFRHQPALRGKILPAAQSVFRDLDLAQMDARMVAAGMPADWRTPSAEREAARRAFLAGRDAGDLWVFAYGSLMWDPSVEFHEVRKARCDGFSRSFCLWDEGARGSPQSPGLMLALDAGGWCEGLAFRIPADRRDHETFVLFRREMIAPAYRPAWLALDTDQGPIEALGFVADRTQDKIRPGIAVADQARMIATARGMLGTNAEYLDGIDRQLRVLGIEDAYVARLVAAVRGHAGGGECQDGR
ncbi:MAG: gamma-glutamylcyclotransferase [Rhodobacter sp.]|nr:gamma-glutamylcyclotransferase [Rhodobacter sp.]